MVYCTGKWKAWKRVVCFHFTGNITIMEARWADDISSPCTCLLFILSHYAAVLSSTYESPNASFLFFTAGCSLFFSFTLYFSLSFSFDVSPLNHDRQILVSDSGLTRALGHVGTAQSVGRMRNGAVSQTPLSTIHLCLTYLFEHPAAVPVTCLSECPLSKSLTMLSIKRSTQHEVFMNWADNILQT